ncbi:hypothetical protein Tco_1318276 [Tanacetum coccineum]|uniref:Uncharacterized protein n=1 Tax=Tanacetum coccineum TaxID=301880 RepID=A0ABQ5H106_9ASTR
MTQSLKRGGYRATHSIDSKVSGGGSGCEVLGGKSSKSSMDGCEEVGEVNAYLVGGGGMWSAWSTLVGENCSYQDLVDTLCGELVVFLVSYYVYLNADGADWRWMALRIKDGRY